MNSKHKLVGCLVKGPMGCLAFLVGALVVTALVMPRLLGPLAAQAVADDLFEEFDGHLDLEGARLFTFFSEQRIRDLILLDPDVQPIALASWSGPGLTELGEGAPVDLGRLRVRELDVVEYPDGSTNVSRCFARRGGRRGSPSFQIQTEGGAAGECEAHMDLVVEELRWTREGEDAPVLVLRDLVGELALAGHDWQQLELRLRGRVADTAGAAGAADGRTELGFATPHWVDFLFNDRRLEGQRLSLELLDVPAGVLDAGVAMGDTLRAAFGDELERFHVSWEVQREAELVTLDVRAPRASLEVNGSVVERPRQPAGADDDWHGDTERRFEGGALVRFEPGSGWDRGLVFSRELLPFFEQVHLEEDQSVQVVARRLVQPLDLDFSRLRAQVDVTSGALTCTLAPTLRAQLAETSLAPQLRFPRAQLALTLDGPRVGFSRVLLGEQQDAIEVQGAFVRGGDEFELRVELPASEQGPRTVTWAGPRGASKR